MAGELFSFYPFARNGQMTGRNRFSACGTTPADRPLLARPGARQGSKNKRSDDVTVLSLLHFVRRIALFLHRESGTLGTHRLNAALSILRSPILSIFSGAMRSCTTFAFTNTTYQNIKNTQLAFGLIAIQLLRVEFLHIKHAHTFGK